MTGKEALLQAFDRLFDAAAAKLNVQCTPEERADAKAQFVQRFGQALDMTAAIDVPGIPAEVLTQMEAGITDMSQSELAGLIASIPLAQQTQDMLRVLALRQAEQKLLEHYASRADTRWGGN